MNTTSRPNSADFKVIRAAIRVSPTPSITEKSPLKVASFVRTFRWIKIERRHLESPSQRHSTEDSKTQVRHPFPSPSPPLERRHIDAKLPFPVRVETHIIGLGTLPAVHRGHSFDSTTPNTPSSRNRVTTGQKIHMRRHHPVIRALQTRQQWTQNMSKPPSEKNRTPRSTGSTWSTHPSRNASPAASAKKIDQKTFGRTHVASAETTGYGGTSVEALSAPQEGEISSRVFERHTHTDK